MSLGKVQIGDMSNSKYAKDLQRFPENVIRMDRAKVISVILNTHIDQFDGGDNAEGIQAFQHAIRLRIRMARLSDKKWYLVKHVGVHPDNREGVGLVPIDVHDLLSQIVKDGWNYELVDALAGEVPPDHVFMETQGHQFQVSAWLKKFNRELVEQAGGLLPKIIEDDMKIVTARGSHTTALVRCMEADDVVGVHDNTMNQEGFVSRAVIVDAQPTMQQPLDHGIEYEVVSWELVTLVPRLMEVLSRTGNATHGVHRQETPLQAMIRTHNVYKVVRPKNDQEWTTKVAAAVARGKPDEYRAKIQAFIPFVRYWSGGDDKHILVDLCATERRLDIKRVLDNEQIQKLGELKLPEAPRFPPAMFKSMLMSPTDFVSGGVVHMFNSTHFMSLGPGGNNRKNAKHAHDLMQASHDYLNAYSVMDATSKMRLLDLCEMRLVMLVLNIRQRVQTRAPYDCQERICEQLRKDALELDPSLPEWPLLAGLGEQVLPTVGRAANITEVRLSGDVPDSELEAHGFVAEAEVKLKSPPEDDDAEYVYQIWDLTDRFTVKLYWWDEEGNEEELTVTRAQLLEKWKVHVEGEVLASRDPFFFLYLKTRR
jgi:hypothetical protein